MAPRVENLRESADRAVRVVALGHLADATAARDRLVKAEDDEALHDFRVALRRLRSWERAFRPYLDDDLKRKLRRRLRNLARDTGASRDLEVHIAWLNEQRRSLGRRQRPGLSWVLANLDKRKGDADAVLEEDIDARFKRVRTRLERALSSYRATVDVRPNGRATPLVPFAIALAPRIRDAASELKERLDLVKTLTDEVEAHESRIAAKRLRYLLEPIVKSVRGADELVDRLKSLQDVLGDLHDSQVFGAEIGEMAASLASSVAPNEAEVEPSAAGVDTAARPLSPEVPPEPATAEPDGPPATAPIADGAPAAEPPAAVPAAPDPLPGIAVLTERLRSRANTAFTKFSSEWLGENSAPFFRDVDEVADRVEAAATAGIEIERKYLLRYLPEKAWEGRRVEIDQGYVPGTELHERIRRVRIRHANGRRDIHYYRTVKLGQGIARTEIEEQTTEAIFDAMWPLTRGKRLRKRRFAIDVNGRTWEVDQFKNRELVLAEIELESEDEEVTFPDWLAPAVERDVTTEPAFQNINLAR